MAYVKYEKPRFDEEGKPVCEICGKSFHVLGRHIIQKHEVTMEEYCLEFGFNPHKGITSEAYREKMQEFSERNREAILHNLKKAKEYEYK